MKTKLVRNLQKMLAVGVLVGLYVLFAVASAIKGTNFLSTSTLTNILDCSYYVGMMAIGTTFVIISGGIDLSIGAMMMCGGLVAGVLFSRGVPILLSLFVGVLLCTTVGFINGLLIAKLRLAPFIATLGTMNVSIGLGAILTKVQTQRFPSIGMEGSWFKSLFFKINEGPLADTFLKGFPVGILWLLLATFFANFLLRKTRLGRYTYAIGSNEEAVRLSGVNVDKWKIAIYTICGFFCGLSSIWYAATYTSLIPSTGGDMNMGGIAAVIIGGTSMSGGSGSLTGTLIGVFIMSVLKQGLMALGLQSHWQTFFMGVVVVLAVMLDNYRNKVANKI